MLSILSCYVDQTPDIKFFIIWLPEPQIHSELRLAALRPTTKVLTLHYIDHFPADDNIRLFWGIQLADIWGWATRCKILGPIVAHSSLPDGSSVGSLFR